MARNRARSRCRSRGRWVRRNGGVCGGNEVVLRLLRGEPLDTLSRELGVEIYRLEQWREKAVVEIDEALRDRTGDPLQTELDAAICQPVFGICSLTTSTFG